MSRYKKLFDYLETELNAIALDSNLMEIEDIVKEMMVEDKPEPLNPHTCELCVGDVCRYVGDNNRIPSHNDLVFLQMTTTHCVLVTLTGVVYYVIRRNLILTQRAGVQIEAK